MNENKQCKNILPSNKTFMMTNLKKTVAVFAAFVLFMINGSAFASTFKDVPTTAWYHDFVQDLVDTGVVDKSDNYRPNDPVNRAELVKMVINKSGGFFGYTSPGISPFIDVKKGEWYYDYVQAAAKKGIVSGYKDALGKSTGKFGSGDSVTRGQAAKILVNAFNVPSTLMPASTFVDVDKNAWYNDYVLTAYNQSIVDGYKDPSGNPTGEFGPNNHVTRAEIAKMIVNAQNPKLRGGSSSSSASSSSGSSSSGGSSSSSSSSGSSGGATTTSSSGSGTPAVTSGYSKWTTYAEKDSFSVEYPDEWTMKKDIALSVFYFYDKSNKNIFSVMTTPAFGKSIDQAWQERVNLGIFKDKKDITIDGQKAVAYKDNIIKENTYYTVVYNDVIYDILIGTGYVKDYNNTTDKLLKGVKLLAPKPVTSTTSGYANWTTFTEAGAFSTDHPAGWTTFGNIGSIPPASGTAYVLMMQDEKNAVVYHVMIQNNTSGKTLDQVWQYEKSQIMIPVTKVADVTIAGKKAIKYGDTSTSNPMYSYLFLHGNLIYTLMIDDNMVKYKNDTIDKILKGFKLLGTGVSSSGPSATGTYSKWSTFTETGTFSVDYPDELKTNSFSAKVPSTSSDPAYSLLFEDTKLNVPIVINVKYNSKGQTLTQVWQDASVADPTAPYTKMSDLTIGGEKAIKYTYPAGSPRNGYLFLHGNLIYDLIIKNTQIKDSANTVSKLLSSFKFLSSGSSSGTPNASSPTDYTTSNWITYTNTGVFTSEYPDEWISTKIDTSKPDGTGSYNVDFTDKKYNKVYSIKMESLTSASYKDVESIWNFELSSSNTKVYDVTIAGQKAIGYAKNIPDDYIYYIFTDSNTKFTLAIDETALTKGTVEKLRNGFNTVNTPAGTGGASAGWVTYTETGLFTSDYPNDWKTEKTNTLSGSNTSGTYVLKFKNSSQQYVYFVNMRVLSNSQPKTLDELWKTMPSNFKKVYDVTIAGQKAIGYTDTNGPGFTHYTFIDGNNHFTITFHDTALTNETVVKLRNNFKTPNTPASITYPDVDWFRYTAEDSFISDYPSDWKAKKMSDIKNDGSGQYKLVFDSSKYGSSAYVVNISLAPGGASITAEQAWKNIGSPSKMSDLTIGGKQAIAYQDFTDFYYIFTYKNFIYELQIDRTIEKSIIDKVLQAFMFL